MSLFATNTSTFFYVHHKTGCWISQDLLDIHTAVTEGDFCKAGILIGEKAELNGMYADNTTILLQLCKTIRKKMNPLQYLWSRCSWRKEPELT